MFADHKLFMNIVGPKVLEQAASSHSNMANIPYPFPEMYNHNVRLSIVAKTAASIHTEAQSSRVGKTTLGKYRWSTDGPTITHIAHLAADLQVDKQIAEQLHAPDMHGSARQLQPCMICLFALMSNAHLHAIWELYAIVPRLPQNEERNHSYQSEPKHDHWTCNVVNWNSDINEKSMPSY